MIEIKKLNKFYGNKNIKYNDFIINQPGLYFLIGPKESGKTTLLNMLSTLDLDFNGMIKIDNVSINTKNSDFLLRTCITYITQKQNISLPWTVNQYINIISKDHNKIKALFVQLDIYKLMQKRLQEVDEFDKQKIFLAKAFLAESPIILLDEPTYKLDKTLAKKFILIVEELAVKYKKIVLISTEDSSYIVNNNKIYFENDVFKNNLQCGTNKKFQKKITKRNFGTNYLKIFAKKSGFIVHFITLTIVAFSVLFFFTWTLGSFLDAVDWWKATLPDENTIVIKNSLNWEQNECMIIAEEYICEEEYSYSSIPGHLGFSTTEVNAVSNINGVESVEMMLQNPINPISSSTDYNLNKISTESAFLTEDELKTYSKEMGNFWHSFLDSELHKEQGGMYYDFQMFYDEPDKIASLTANDNYYWYGTQLIYGSYNYMDANDIIIPHHLAIILSDQLGVEVFELIGMHIPISIITPDNQQKTIEYDIAGIYQDDYEDVPAEYFSYIYTAYNSKAIDYGFQLNNPNDSYQYDYLNNIDDLSTEVIQYEYPQATYANEAAYEKSFGTGSQVLIINLETDANVASVHNQLYNIFPNYTIQSQYEFSKGNKSKSIKQEIFNYFLIAISLGILLALILVFFKRPYFNQLKQEFVNYRLTGISKTNIRKTVIWETAITLFLLLCSAIALIKIFSIQIEKLENINIEVVLLTTITLLISIFPFLYASLSFRNGKRDKVVTIVALICLVWVATILFTIYAHR